MTQHQAIIHYLKNHPEGLTTFEAFLSLNQTKLTSRISELRTQGYIFNETWETHNGKKWLRYKLVSDPVQFKTEGSQVCFV